MVDRRQSRHTISLELLELVVLLDRFNHLFWLLLAPYSAAGTSCPIVLLRRHDAVANSTLLWLDTDSWS